jgi:hypothetical protein
VHQAKVHLEKLYALWTNIDLKNWNKDTADNFTSEDQTLFVISKLIDKCAIMIMQCGFSINDLSK